MYRNLLHHMYLTLHLQKYQIFPDKSHMFLILYSLGVFTTHYYYTAEGGENYRFCSIFIGYLEYTHPWKRLGNEGIVCICIDIIWSTYKIWVFCSWIGVKTLKLWKFQRFKSIAKIIANISITWQGFIWSTNIIRTLKCDMQYFKDNS